MLAVFVGFEVILEEVFEREVLLAGGMGAVVCCAVSHISQLLGGRVCYVYRIKIKVITYSYVCRSVIERKRYHQNVSQFKL